MPLCMYLMLLDPPIYVCVQLVFSYRPKCTSHVSSSISLTCGPHVSSYSSTPFFFLNPPCPLPRAPCRRAPSLPVLSPGISRAPAALDPRGNPWPSVTQSSESSPQTARLELVEARGAASGTSVAKEREEGASGASTASNASVKVHWTPSGFGVDSNHNLQVSYFLLRHVQVL